MIEKILEFIKKNKAFIIFLICVITMVALYITINIYYATEPTVERLIPFILFEQFVSHIVMIFIVVTTVIFIKWFIQENDNESKKKVLQGVRVALIVFLFVYMLLSRPNYLKKYYIKEKRPTFIEFLVNANKDLIYDDKEKIKVNTIDFEIVKAHNTRSKGKNNPRYLYFVNINSGEYVLPYAQIYSIERVLESIGPHEIMVYKNTKMIESIDGCKIYDISEVYSQEFEQKREKSQYTISVENNIIKVCNNYNNTMELAMNYCDNKGNVSASINYTGQDLDIDYGINIEVDGLYSIYLVNRKNIQVSNKISFECANGEVINIMSK